MTVSISNCAIRMAVIKPQDRLDAWNARAMREQLDLLLREGTTVFIIDLSQTRFMDSAGLAVIVNLLKHVRRTGGDVKLTQPEHEVVQRLLDLTRFDQVFDLVDSVATAAASVQISVPVISSQINISQTVENPHYVVPNTVANAS